MLPSSPKIFSKYLIFNIFSLRPQRIGLIAQRIFAASALKWPVLSAYSGNVILRSSYNGVHRVYGTRILFTSPRMKRCVPADFFFRTGGFGFCQVFDYSRCRVILDAAHYHYSSAALTFAREHSACNKQTNCWTYHRRDCGVYCVFVYRAGQLNHRWKS